MLVVTDVQVGPSGHTGSITVEDSDTGASVRIVLGPSGNGPEAQSLRKMTLSKLRRIFGGADVGAAPPVKKVVRMTREEVTMDDVAMPPQDQLNLSSFEERAKNAMSQVYVDRANIAPITRPGKAHRHPDHQWQP